VPDELRRQRLLARHMRFGRSRAQALDWMERTDEPNAVRIAKTRQHAQLCVPWI
jgi:pantothenate kinase